MRNGGGFIHSLPSDIRALSCNDQEDTVSLGLRVESTELERPETANLDRDRCNTCALLCEYVMGRTLLPDRVR